MIQLAEKLPPQSLEAEQSVLGSMLIEKEAIVRAVESLREEDFYRESHRLIWSAILELFERNEAADLVTVSELLKARNKLEGVGGLGYLAALTGAVPTAANVEYYARIVEEKSLLRHLIGAATTIAGRGYDGSEEAASLLDEAEQMIFSLSERRHAQKYIALKEVLVETFERIEGLYGSPGGVTGVPIGFRDLDHLTSGLQASDLIVIAARPSMGKTMLALNMARYAAIEGKAPVAIFSLEMSREQLAQRLLATEAGVNSHRLRSGYLADDDWQKIATAIGRLAEAPIFIDDAPVLTSLELRARARRIKAEHGLGLVVVDYLQLMQIRGKSESRQQEISQISRSLKALARELKVPVVALSQLSRAVESRPDRRPLLSDLRESGAIEQDADLVAFIYREDYYNREEEVEFGEAEIIVAKQRNGPTGMVKLGFRREFGRFYDLDTRHANEGEARTMNE